MVRTPSISLSSSEKDKDRATATLSSAFASMVAVGAPHHSSNNGSLKIEDVYNSGKDDDERSSRQSKKSNRLSSAFGRSRSRGRSVSPFRFGSKKRSNSANRLKVNPDEDTDVETTGDSDAESTHSGIVPRNSAFHHGQAGEEEEEDIARSRSQLGLGRGRGLPKSGSSTSLDETHGVEADVESDDGGFDADDFDAPKRSSISEEDDVEEEEEEEPLSEMDSIVMDNTLYNAECLTSHDHWKPATTGSGNDSTDHHHNHGGIDDHHFETYEDEDLERDDDYITAPNVVLSEDQVSTFLQRRGSKMLSLTTSRPRFERNDAPSPSNTATTMQPPKRPNDPNATSLPVMVPKRVRTLSNGPSVPSSAMATRCWS